jgi:hypothetical protein
MGKHEKPQPQPDPTTGSNPDSGQPPPGGPGGKHEKK